MSRYTGVPQSQSRPLGHSFQSPGYAPVSNTQVKLITAYRAPSHIEPDALLHVEPNSLLRSDYEQAMTHVTHADQEYQRDLRSLLQTFPQGESEVPARPTPEQMQVLFKKVLYRDQARPRGKGSKDGVKHYECKWPACPFKGPIQRCIDHFFCEHVKLQFFKCEQPNCERKFMRKNDLIRHKEKQHSSLRPREQRGDRGVAGPSQHTRSRDPIQHQPYSTQGRSTRRRHAIERSQGDRDPRTASITGTAGLTQTKPSGPLGQFQVCLVKPLVRFLTMPYLRAQRILQFSRTVHVFHMQSVYIARQAIHLVIILNDLVDEREGPDDEQYQERIDLEDELIELFDAMQEWGAKPDDELQVDYDQGLLKINQQYAQFFRQRFYFHNVRNSADDFIYGKLVAYDRKTIDFRKEQYSRLDPTSMDVDLNGSKARDEGKAGHGSEAYIESVTSSPESSGIDISTGQEMLTHPINESSAGETHSTASVSPGEFLPVLEGRLFTAHDSIVGAACEVHPTARLLYDSLPQYYRDVFKNCPMYPEKHLEFVKYLRHLSLNDLDKKNEPSSEKNLIKTLGIPVSTEEGDKKKWRCSVVGCRYRGTLQHLVAHLRTKSHIGIPIFACTHCKILFHQFQDRDRHVKEKTCLKSRLVEDSPEPQGSTRSLRGVRDQVAPATKPKIKFRSNQHLKREREYQVSAATSAQSVNNPRTRKGVHYPRFRDEYNPCIPSFTPPQPFDTSVHRNLAYNQTHSNVPTSQDGSVRLLTPDFFRTESILPTNNGGMHAKVIENNYTYLADHFQPISNPQFAPESQPVKPESNYPTGLTYAYPGFDIRGQDPEQSSTSGFANFAGNFYRDGAPHLSHRRPQDSLRPPPDIGASSRPDATSIKEEEVMRVDLENGGVAMDVTP